MRVKTTRPAKLADLQTNLFVREALDEKHAMMLGELIESGVEMTDLIEVAEIAGVLSIVDGRHRKVAYELNDIVEVKVKILEFEDDAEMIAYAYRKNTGGSKPPTAADTERTVKLLLEKKETMKRIGELLGLPTNLARKYANEVRSRMNRVALMKARDMVAGGEATAAQAAERCDVDLDKLKEALSGKHGGKRGNRLMFKDVHRNLSRLYNGLGKKNAALVKRFMERFEDGDVTETQVRDIFKHIKDLQKKANRSFADWEKRFEARVGGKETEGKLTSKKAA
jgi:hypothetical protein